MIPKKLRLSRLLLEALDFNCSFNLAQKIMYLWREFLIVTKIHPIVKEYIIEFYYKDEQLAQFKIEKLSDLIRICNLMTTKFKDIGDKKNKDEK